MSSHYIQKNEKSQSFDRIFLVHKHRGETLAVLLERVRQVYEIPESVPLTYAGRLDPMATGLVLILSGARCHDKDDFLGLDKTYRFSILFGITTDTLDVLGIPETPVAVSVIDGEKIAHFIAGVTRLPYPPYSSRTVAGIPLFVHARSGTVPTLPEREVSIEQCAYLGQERVSLASLLPQIVADVGVVVGDFRQELIAEAWRQYRADNTSTVLAHFEATVSSGTYIRALAKAAGEYIGTPACAYTIERTAIRGLEAQGVLV